MTEARRYAAEAERELAEAESATQVIHAQQHTARAQVWATLALAAATWKSV